MTFFRSILVAVATFVAVGATSASAADWPLPAPVGYAQGGCGGCNVGYAPTLYATPVMPAPITVGGCGGCGGYAPAYGNWGCGGCAAPVAYGGCCAVAAPITYGCGGCGVPGVYTPPAPIYVVNQGPEFVGPGVMVPFHTYAPPAQYAPYPLYYGHRYYPRVAYGAHVYYHPRLYGPRPYWRRPYWHG